MFYSLLAILTTPYTKCLISNKVVFVTFWKLRNKFQLKVLIDWYIKYLMMAFWLTNKAFVLCIHSSDRKGKGNLWDLFMRTLTSATSTDSTSICHTGNLFFSVWIWRLPRHIHRNCYVLLWSPNSSSAIELLYPLLTFAHVICSQPKSKTKNLHTMQNIKCLLNHLLFSVTVVFSWM